MSKIRICDRCGKPVEAWQKPISIHPVFYILGIPIKKYDFSGVHDLRTEYDLCEDCVGGLEEFLRGGDA